MQPAVETAVAAGCERLQRGEQPLDADESQLKRSRAVLRSVLCFAKLRSSRFCDNPTGGPPISIPLIKLA